MEQSTTITPVRNVAIDLYRVVAIVFVVLGHWLIAALTYRDGEFGRQEPLVALPWTQWLTWTFQVAPVFFVVAGYASALSWTRWHQYTRGSRQQWLRRRLARIVGPTATYVALVMVVVIVLLGAGVRGPLAVGGWAVAMHLWFLAVFIAVLALTPVLMAADRRWGLGVPAALALTTAVVDTLAIGVGVPYVGSLNYVFCWAAIYQLGIAWYGSRLDGGRAVTLTVAAATVLTALVTLGPYPVSMIAVGGAPVQNTSPPTAALLMFGTLQAGLLLMMAAPLNRALVASRWERPISLANKNVMSLYLWHMVPVLVVALVGYPTGLLPQPTIGTGAWWIARLEWLGLLSVVTAAELVLLRWTRALFAAPLATIDVALPPRWTETMLFGGVAAAALSLAKLAADGFAPHAGIPVFTSLLFGAGLILTAIGSRCEPHLGAEQIGAR